ncbi:tetratricopeptide repeat protein [Dasania sp. GY-MA-18]|uniref:Tetratricopeptide repeat protein n=1 Tax=Dasania phycosphaerae TaxID=2950436 RepID=A0A9J6RH89_9GAMM|nr:MULTISPECIES: tetratricopeptide repeat protein [Dasania]MCR8921286.1 tetratricopeptide repeat protein [Dasania sp. GY-MA-18]MCZ0863714.1 tetratricopeptide repeat protein [Dasania phycosphaerae]MCZ0867442.1 tetratricopeptide repeat protein [Dasania phycosphaerae]
MHRFIIIIALFLSTLTFAQEHSEQQLAKAQAEIEALKQPLYNPFVERYILDEVKALRVDQANIKHELMQKILDREHNSVDRAVSYATDTVTYFFYLIAAATSVLVLVGWTSIRDMKERVHSLADEEISKLVVEYENRLAGIEKQLHQKTKHIEENRDEIGLTQELQSLWLRAQQESSIANKITIYDDILKLRPSDCEALTYKADAVLELHEPQWAANLCLQALKIDPENSHAFYQLACAYTAMQQFEEAVRYLNEAIKRTESYREDIEQDPALAPLVVHDLFKKTFALNTTIKKAAG